MTNRMHSSPSRRRAGIVVALALALPAAGPATASALPTLERGDRGASVKRLQRALHLHADGVFGAGTARAVRRFQRRHDLKADGIVGASTWRMLRRSARRTRVASRSGGKAAAVRLLQRKLGIAADGVFGPGTARAVRAFQRRRGLAADGVVGPGTWAALGVHGRPVLKRARLRGTSTRGGVPVAVRRAIAAANRIARLPYRYGGGHRSFTDTGYDCSGSVSYVLHGAGRLSSPLDSSSLMRYGAPGRGRWITIYAHSGHTYMVINGRRYDTTGRSSTGTRWQPSGRSTAGYVVRHPPGL
jgi:peptidoglycan hydrolase-like protein with peptidoglycan-binding domain